MYTYTARRYCGKISTGNKFAEKKGRFLLPVNFNNII